MISASIVHVDIESVSELTDARIRDCVIATDLLVVKAVIDHRV